MSFKYDVVHPKRHKSSLALNTFNDGSVLVSSILKKFKENSSDCNQSNKNVASLFQSKERYRVCKEETLRHVSFDKKLKDGIVKGRLLSSQKALTNQSQPNLTTEQKFSNITLHNQSNAKRYLTEEQRKEVSRRTIFVGNIPLSYDANALRRFLQIPRSQIESIRFRSVPVDPKFCHQRAWATKAKMFSGECQIKNAYIVFVSERDSREFLSLNKSFMTPEGNTLRSTSTSFHRKAFSLFGLKSTVFVGNLYVKVTEDDLRQAFEKKVGPVKNVRIIRDPIVYISKCFGFVQLVNRHDVPKAIKTMNGFILRKRPLHVTKALPQEKASQIDESRKKMIQRKIKMKCRKKLREKKKKKTLNDNKYHQP